MQKHYLLGDFQGLYLKDQDKGTTSVPKTMTTSLLLVSVAVTVLPLSAAYECLGRWVFGRVVCDTWLVVDVLYCTASIWNLCVIAADRFTATMFPIWYRERPTPIMPVRSHTVLRAAAFPRVSFHFGTMSAKLPCCHFNLVSQASGHCISNLVPGASFGKQGRRVRGSSLGRGNRSLCAADDRMDRPAKLRLEERQRHVPMRTFPDTRFVCPSVCLSVCLSAH